MQFSTFSMFTHCKCTHHVHHTQSTIMPMGGPNSAELACLYMAVRDTENTVVALFYPPHPCVRLPRQYLLVWPKVTVAPALSLKFSTLASYYCMPVQFEQMGSCSHVLEVPICLHPVMGTHAQAEIASPVV